MTAAAKPANPLDVLSWSEAVQKGGPSFKFKGHATRCYSLDVEEGEVDSSNTPTLGRLSEMCQGERPTGAIEALAFPMPPLVLTALCPLRPGRMGVALLV